MAFTDQEKARILHFLAYPNWQALSQSIQLGYPAASQPLFLVEDSFRRLFPFGEESVRKDLCELESIESQLSSARGRFKATQLGDLKVNAMETEQLQGQLEYWTCRLEDDLGVVRNPYSANSWRGAMQPGGLNARVMG